MKDRRSIAKQQIENDIANKRYNPMNDVLFKFIFGRDERKNYGTAFPRSTKIQEETHK